MRLNTDPRARSEIKPLLAHETVLPEYEPPRMPGSNRLLRPAEMDALIRERVADRDVTATLVDLAVRQHIRFEGVAASENGDGGMTLARLPSPPEDSLEPFELRLLESLFDPHIAGRPSSDDGLVRVSLSSLEGAFWIEWGRVKGALYDEIVRRDGLFSRNPEQDRNGVGSFGPAFVLLSAFACLPLGFAYGAALLLVPAIVTSVGLFFVGRAAPCRTGLGRELLRRSLGFRLFLTEAFDSSQWKPDERSLDRYLGTPSRWVLRPSGLAGSRACRRSGRCRVGTSTASPRRPRTATQQSVSWGRRSNAW